MGVYTRYKKSPTGFRQIVELIETTPMSRRQKMIDVGMSEDPEYTRKVLSFVLSFSDVIHLPDLELAEVLGSVPGQWIGFSIHNQPKEVQDRFMSQSRPKSIAEIKEVLEDSKVTAFQISAAQSKLIQATRALEKKGYVKTKSIPSD